MEIIANLLDLNIGYFIGIAMNGIFWIFAFAAAAHYFGNGKKWVANFMVITGLLLSFTDLLKAHNLIFYTAPALLVLYFARMSVLTALEGSGLGRHIPLAYSVLTYTILLFYNFFMA